MINVNVDKLVRIKNILKDDNDLQNLDLQDAKCYIVEDYFEKSKRYLDIKAYFENRLQGLIFNISGGGKNYDGGECDYVPLLIETYKQSQKGSYNVMKFDGSLLDEHPSMIFDKYLDVIVNNPDTIEKYHKSIWEIVLDESLCKTYLSESGFTVTDNALLLFGNEKIHTIIDNIEAKVQGVIMLNLPNELDESIIVVCVDKVVLISDDLYYVDLGHGDKEVA